MDRKVDFFLAGFQKCATSWIYECLRDHPDVFVPSIDETHFFTINYDRGLDWYHSFYSEYDDEEAVGDTTPTYAKSGLAARRISEYNEEAKIIFSLRNPIDRAFSHYWHEKKKGKIAFSFDEAVEYRGVGNYDLFDNWIKTGFYDLHIGRYIEQMGKDNILIVLLDDLKDDPHRFIRSIYNFIGVDSSYKPDVLDTRVNAAWHRLFGMDRFKERTMDVLLKPVKAVSNTAAARMRDYLHVQSEYERGMKPETRARLRSIYRPHISSLEDQLDRSLENWT
jgi:hypothetical protein